MMILAGMAQRMAAGLPQKRGAFGGIGGMFDHFCHEAFQGLFAIFHERRPKARVKFIHRFRDRPNIDRQDVMQNFVFSLQGMNLFQQRGVWRGTAIGGHMQCRKKG